MSCLLWSVRSFTFIICFVCNVMSYFTSTVLFICLFRAHYWFNLFDPLSCSLVLVSHLPDAQQFEKHCHLHVNFGTAAYEIPNCAKLWYRTVWNIINTGIPRIPNPHKQNTHPNTHPDKRQTLYPDEQQTLTHPNNTHPTKQTNTHL